MGNFKVNDLNFNIKHQIFACICINKYLNFSQDRDKKLLLIINISIYLHYDLKLL